MSVTTRPPQEHTTQLQEEIACTHEEEDQERARVEEQEQDTRMEVVMQQAVAREALKKPDVQDMPSPQDLSHSKPKADGPGQTDGPIMGIADGKKEEVKMNGVPGALVTRSRVQQPARQSSCSTRPL